MDKGKAVAEAVRAVLDAVQGADAQEMLGKRPKPAVASPGAPGDGDGDECADCAKGTCVEHLDDKALSDMMGEG